MNALLTIDIIGLALFAWACVFKIVPSYALSHHRYRLWRLRDQLADEIRHGKYQDSEQPRKVLAMTEGTIECLHALSALNSLLFQISRKGSKLQAPEPWDLTAMLPADRHLIERRIDELQAIIRKYVLAGTPSGWACSMLLTPVALVVVSLKRLNGQRDGESLLQGTRVQVREEFDMDSIAIICGQPARPRHSLYQRV